MKSIITLRIIPFLIIFLIISYTCFEILKAEYVFTTKHYLAIALIVINGILYFVRYKIAILLTGIILLLATFNVINIFTSVNLDAFGIKIGDKPIGTPPMQLWSLLILIIYFFINLRYVFTWKSRRNE